MKPKPSVVHGSGATPDRSGYLSARACVDCETLSRYVLFSADAGDVVAGKVRCNHAPPTALPIAMAESKPRSMEPVRTAVFGQVGLIDRTGVQNSSGIEPVPGT